MRERHQIKHRAIAEILSLDGVLRNAQPGNVTVLTLLDKPLLSTLIAVGSGNGDCEAL